MWKQHIGWRVLGDVAGAVLHLRSNAPPASGAGLLPLDRSTAVSLLVVALPAFLFSTWSPAHAGAVASDFKPEHRQGANTWNAQAAIDGKLETAWQLPGESKNTGEWLILDVPKSNLDKIGMIVGWAKDEDHFKDYARVKAIKVEAMAYDENNELQPVGEGTATFEDKMEYQVVDIDDIQIGDDLFGGKVKITITEVYPGRDYPNLAVSEVSLHLAEFDAGPIVEEVSSEDDGHSRDLMIDDNDKTFWVGDAAGASMGVKVAGFSVARIGLNPGPKDYARPKKVRLTAHNRSHDVELPDAVGTQWLEIPAIVGFTGSGYQGSEFETLQLEILEVYPGTKFADKVAIREIDAKATAFGGF